MEKNRFAHAVASVVIEDIEVVYNPIWIYGKSGVGKTEFVQDICFQVEKKWGKRVKYLSKENISELINISSNDCKDMSLDMLNKYDLLVIDNAESFINNKKCFAVFKELTEAFYYGKHQLIVVATRIPADLIDDMDLLEMIHKGLLVDME
ncbi:MAG: hypothetical protein K6E13_03135 [Lachnospiraceae bacterium]|nr:hypothetical protein [Lachnospiraceae bacterium]